MAGMTSFADLEAKAKGGDPQAQYAMSAFLSRAGRRSEADEWLAKAVAFGHPDALFTAATGNLKGVGGTKDTGQAIAQLRAAVDRKGNAARRLLAALTAAGVGCASDWNAAVSLLLDACRDGDPPAIRQIGLLLEIASPGTPLSAELLARAARSGDGLAAFALLRREYRHRGSVTTEEAIRWAEGLARARHPLSQYLSSIAGQTAAGVDAECVPGDPDWVAIAAHLERPPAPRLPQQRPLSERPYVWRLQKLLSVEECDYLIGVSAPLVQPSLIHDPRSGVAIRNVRRTSGTAVVSPADCDLVVYCLNLRMASVAAVPASNAEMLSVLRYGLGEEFMPHVDYFADNVESAAELNRSGQRAQTLLVYLNDDYDGGTTQFLANALRVKGQIGDAVLFRNVDSAGMPDLSTMHAGLPVTRGVKWLASTWFRERAYQW